MSIAREFLLSLLKRSQNAVGQGKDEQVYLPLTASSCPNFFKNRNAEDANSFHSELEFVDFHGKLTQGFHPILSHPI